MPREIAGCIDMMDRRKHRKHLGRPRCLNHPSHVSKVFVLTEHLLLVDRVVHAEVKQHDLRVLFKDIPFKAFAALAAVLPWNTEI